MSKSSFYKTTATADEMIAVATSAANAATSETNASASASNASTSETNASNSATAAANSATSASNSASTATTQATNASNSASTATTKASEASTSATNSATSASNASNSASAAATSATNLGTAETNASNSATSASNSASTATTKASEASTSATNASNSASSASTSATNASNSASTATTKASEAATSATNASNSASTATTKASEASTSATNAASSATSATSSASTATTKASEASTSASQAATSAANAASSFDNFDDRYLGQKSGSDPTVDNDGNALVTGALYFSSSSNVMKVYDGGSWIAATSAGTSSLNIFKYVVTSGTQSTFSGSDSNNATLTYTVANIIVTLNGVVLDASDFTASNGTSIVLGSNAVTNDEVVIYAFKTFEIANALSLATGGTVAGNTTFNGTLTGTLTGNSDTATTATNVTATANNSADETVYPTFVDGATGSQGIETDTGLNYNPSTGNLTSTTFTGNLTGNVTGNVTGNTSGTASTVTTAAQPNITSVGTLTGLTVSGDASVGDDLSLNSDGAIINFGVDSDVTLTHVHNAGLKLNDDRILYLGDDQDFQFSHVNSSNLQIIDANSRLLIRSPRIDFQNGDGSETTAVSIADGVFSLFHDNTERLSTNANGINLNSTTVSGNPANAKLIVNSASQYDGIALGTGASSAVIGRHSNGGGMHLTANSAPANMGGGTKVGFQFSSGTSGGSSPVDIFKILTNGYLRVGSDNNGRISLGNRTNTGNAYIGKLNDDVSVTGNTCAINFGSTSGEDFLDFHTHHSGLTGGKMITLWGDSTWVHSYFQNTTKGGTNAYSMYPAGSGNAPLSYYNKTLTSSSFSHIFAVSSSTVGSISYTSSGTSFNTSSDYRLKENVSYDWDATSRLKELKPARFNFKVDKEKTVDGFLAHEVSSIVPEAITGSKDDVHLEDVEGQNIKKGDPVYQTIDQSKLVPLLVKTIQELEARITALEKA